MKASRRQRIVSRWEKGLGYHLLLVALLLGMLLIALTEELGWSAVVLHGVYFLIFFEALSVAARGRLQQLIGLSLLLPDFLHWLLFGEESVLFFFPALDQQALPYIFVAVCRTLFAFYLIGLTVLRVFQHSKITWSQVSAAASAYLLLGYAWRGIYLYLNHIEPGISFDGLTEGKEEGDFIYYSFVTLTTLGYGDVTPISQAARLFSILEAIVGQLFLVILLARLVGMVRVYRDGGESAAAESTDGPTDRT